MKITDLSKRSKLRILVYANPGAGKTTFTGTAALDERTAPVLHIDASGNPESLTRHASLPDVISLDKLEELNPIYAWLAAGMPADHLLVKKYGLRTDYKTLVFDGITAVQRKVFDVAMGTVEPKPGDTPPKAEWPHYGAVLRHMLKIAYAFYHTLDMNVLMTALEHTDMREMITGSGKFQPYAEPALAGQAREELPGEALAVIRMVHATNDVSRAKELNARHTIAQLQPTTRAYAKDQHGFGVPFVGDITVSKLLDALARR